MESLIVIGASVGGLEALSTIVASLPADFPAPILAVSHVGARKSALPEILAWTSTLPVRHARDGDAVQPGCILLAPPDWHMLVTRKDGHGVIVLSHEPKEQHTRPAIDPLFRSAAFAYGAGVVGVVLSGYLDDGTAGLQAIKQCGGKAVVQEPQEAIAPYMPQNALDRVAVDLCLPASRIGPALLALVGATAFQRASSSAAGAQC